MAAPPTAVLKSTGRLRLTANERLALGGLGDRFPVFSSHAAAPWAVQIRRRPGTGGNATIAFGAWPTGNSEPDSRVEHLDAEAIGVLANRGRRRARGAGKPAATISLPRSRSVTKLRGSA